MPSCIRESLKRKQLLTKNSKMHELGGIFRKSDCIDFDRGRIKAL